MSLKFPEGFMWGCAISAHQVEGNNTNNDWWLWEQQGHTAEPSGRACDHYNLYEKDFDLAKELKIQVLRFSIEWSRIEPKENAWNEKEVEHYRKVLEALHERGITPMVTLHHFTNPIWFAEKGAWLNPDSPQIFERYVRHIVEKLGDLIEYYNTINEPMVVATMGYYFGVFPPGEKDLAKALIVARNLLLAHARAYHAIHEVAREFGFKKPKVAIVKNIIIFEPLNPEARGDVSEAQMRDLYFNRAFLDSIARGEIVPPFGNNEPVDYLKSTWDFIGLNYYTRMLCSPSVQISESGPVPEGAEITDMGWEVYPEGIYRALMMLKRYGKGVVITENGIATRDDEQRCRFIVRHLAQVHRAIKEGVDVRGYLYWSLIDNFEWNHGFSKRFGLIEVDYNTMERKPRPSAYMFRRIIEYNGVPEDLLKKYL